MELSQDAAGCELLFNFNQKRYVMNYWALIKIARQIFESFPILRLMAIPKDFTDSEAVRTWVRAVVESIEVVTKLTGTKLDDKVLAGLKAALDNDEIWNTVHGILVRLLIGKAPREHPYICDEKIEVEELSAIVGISPTIIMLIIQVVRFILELIRKRLEK